MVCDYQEFFVQSQAHTLRGLFLLAIDQHGNVETMVTKRTEKVSVPALITQTREKRAMVQTLW